MWSTVGVARCRTVERSCNTSSPGFLVVMTIRCCPNGITTVILIIWTRSTTSTIICLSSSYVVTIVILIIWNCWSSSKLRHHYRHPHHLDSFHHQHHFHHQYHHLSLIVLSYVVTTVILIIWNCWSSSKDSRMTSAAQSKVWSSCQLSMSWRFSPSEKRPAKVRPVLFFNRPRSEGWLHHGRTLSIYISLLSFWLTLPRIVLSTYWCSPSRSYVVFVACVHLTLLLALSLSPGNFLVSSWCDHSMLTSLLWHWQCLTVTFYSSFVKIPIGHSDHCIVNFSIFTCKRHETQTDWTSVTISKKSNVSKFAWRKADHDSISTYLQSIDWYQVICCNLLQSCPGWLLPVLCGMLLKCLCLR